MHGDDVLQRISPPSRTLCRWRLCAGTPYSGGCRSTVRLALYCALEAMRVHGGYGYSQEFEVERLYRDAPLMAIGEGTNDVLRIVIAKSLIAGDAAIG
jgi:Acyl-CoA dehydrogenase, C-terminal domain